MTTDEIMALAIRTAGFLRIPEDSAIFVGGRNIRKVLSALTSARPSCSSPRTWAWISSSATTPPVSISTDGRSCFAMEFMTAAGVPEDAALGAVAERIEATKLRGQISNFDRTPSVARLLGMPFMNIHAPLGELGRRRMVEAVNRVLAGGKARSMW